MLNKKQKINLYALYALLSFFFTYYILGYENLILQDVFFTKKYDVLSDQLALKFFLNDEWHFPIGKNPNYGPAEGSSIVFVGGAPIISFISKFIFSIFPIKFNFFILWYLICFFLQMLFGFLIIFYFTKNFLFSFISSFLFIFCPIFLDRIPNHISLAGQWIILLCLFFEFHKKSFSRVLFYSFLYVLASLIHFYFIPIILIIHFSFSIHNFYKEKKLKKIIYEFSFPFIILIFFAFIFGYFEISVFDAMGYGYGYYKANILSFFDPQYANQGINWSIFSYDIKNSSGEREGFSYLGLGIIILLTLQIIKFFKVDNFKIKENFNIILILILSFILSISNNINFGHYELLSFSLPDPIYGILSIVRASGRFIWIINYIIIIFGILTISHLFLKKKYSTIFVTIILIVQIIDISPALINYYNFKAFDKFYFKDHDTDFWKEISKEFKHIKSTNFNNTSGIYLNSANQILKYNFKSTDISRMGRYNRKKITNYRSELNRTFSKNNFEKSTLYIASSINHLNYLKHIHNEKDSKVGFFFRENNWFIIPGYKNKMKISDINNLKKIQLFKVEKNKYYNLKINENNILGIGWTHNNFGYGVWTEGNISTLVFNLNKSKQEDFKILLEVLDIKTDKNKKLNFNIRLNDKLVSKFSKKREDISNNNVLEIRLSNENLNEYEQKLEFIIENPISPLDLYKSPDSRNLGLLVKGYKIK